MPDVTPEPMPLNPDDMPEIRTGNGIDRDYAATSNDRLKKNVLEMRVLNATMGEVVRMQRETIAAEHETKAALGTLTKTIENLDRKNGKLQIVVVWLTVATVLLAIVQVWVAIHTPQQQVVVKEITSKK